MLVTITATAPGIDPIRDLVADAMMAPYAHHAPTERRFDNMAGARVLEWVVTERAAAHALDVLRLSGLDARITAPAPPPRRDPTPGRRAIEAPRRRRP